MAQPTITNRWGTAHTTRLDVHTTTVQTAVPGRSYHHHQHLLAHDGVLYLLFSSGIQNEDDIGQGVMLATSADRGVTWTPPRLIATPPPGRLAPFVLTAGGLHMDTTTPGAPRLVAYYGQFEYTENGLENGIRKSRDFEHDHTELRAIVSADLGLIWDSPRVLMPDFVPNLDPQPAFDGRRIMPGSVVYLYSDDPAGLDGWTWTGLPGLFPDHVDDSAGFQRCRREAPDRLAYCEGSMFCTDDGLVRMMLRTPGHALAVSESADNGCTWSSPRPTEFSDSPSRHQFGRLPDGRVFALSTPDPHGGRTPLVLALSDDGYVFDRHYIIGDDPNRGPRIPGLHKGGYYGYPYLAIAGDTVVVAYSIVKEDVAVSSFPLAALV